MVPNSLQKYIQFTCENRRIYIRNWLCGRANIHHFISNFSQRFIYFFFKFNKFAFYHVSILLAQIISKIVKSLLPAIFNFEIENENGFLLYGYLASCKSTTVWILVSSNSWTCPIKLATLFVLGSFNKVSLIWMISFDISLNLSVQLLTAFL